MACVNVRQICCDQCWVASQAGCREVEKPCACAGSVKRYRRGLGRLGRVGREMESDQEHACCGMAKGIAFACDDRVRGSGSMRGSCILYCQLLLQDYIMGRESHTVSV